MLYRFLAQRVADKIFYGMIFRIAHSKEEAEFYNRMSRECDVAANDWQNNLITNEDLYLRLKVIGQLIGV